MLVAWIIYLLILAVWAIVSFIAIHQVFKYEHPGLGVHKITVIYVILSTALVVSSFVFMFSVDWNSLLYF
jgi:type III secretory pathway component EscR